MIKITKCGVIICDYMNCAQIRLRKAWIQTCGTTMPFLELHVSQAQAPLINKPWQVATGRPIRSIKFSCVAAEKKVSKWRIRVVHLCEISQ